MRATVAGLGLALTALLTSVADPVPEPATPGPVPVSAAAASTPTDLRAASRLTDLAAGTTPDGTTPDGLAATLLAGRRAATGASAAGPPPVDMRLLPDDPGPTPLPGVRQRYRCEPATTTPIVTSASAAPLLWGAHALRLPELWRAAGGKGAGIRLAVIDTGVSRHRLLAGRLVPGGDYVGSGNGLSDCDGHGTAVAGIAAAATDPTTGFSGVAPLAEVIGIRQTSANLVVTDTNGRQRGGGDTTTLARAIVEAVAEGASVVNVSLTSCRPAPSVPTPLQAALHYAIEHNVVVVAAAGNISPGTGADNRASCPDSPDDSTVALPGWYDSDVLAVGATAESGVAASFSYPGPWVDVAAPGQGLMSLSLGGGLLTSEIHNLDQPGTDQLVPMNGTSFAAPFVAGLAVLVRARYPELTARQVINRITATARGAGSRDRTIGYGLVDPLAALTQQGTGVDPAVLPPRGTATATAGSGELTVEPARPPAPGDRTALWGGVLALLLTAAALSLALTHPRRP